MRGEGFILNFKGKYSASIGLRVSKKVEETLRYDVYYIRFDMRFENNKFYSSLIKININIYIYILVIKNNECMYSNSYK